jgi:hypothetical protein
LDLGSSVRKNHQRHRLCQLAAISQQKFLNLFPFVSDGLGGSVDGVDDQNDFNRRIGSRGGFAIDAMKGEDALRSLVVQNGKVLLLQSANGSSRLVRHLHIKDDLAVRADRRRQ